MARGIKAGFKERAAPPPSACNMPEVRHPFAQVSQIHADLGATRLSP